MVLSAIHQQGPKLGHSLDNNEGFQEWCHPPPLVPSSFLLVDSWPYLPYGPGSGTHDLTHLISTQTCVALAFQVWGLILHQSCLVHTHFLLVTCTLWSGPPVVSSFFQLCTNSAWGLLCVPWVSMRNDEWLCYGITSLKVHNNSKCSNNSKHCHWSGINPTEHTCIWSMKTINILVHIFNNYSMSAHWIWDGK